MSVSDGRNQLRGIVPAVVTPFDANEELDLFALERLVERLIDDGVHGLCVLGSQGEFYALDYDEHRAVAEAAVSAGAGRVPVFVGVSAASTRESIRLARAAQRGGADGLILLPPLFVRPDEHEVVGHFEAVAASVDLPMLLYNQPARVGVNLSTALVTRLAAVPNIVGIKDSSGSLAQCLEYRSACPEDFTVVVGHDALVAYALLGGADGSIASTANVVTAELCRIWHAVQEGRLDDAREAQNRVSQFRRVCELSSFPVAALKEALALLGRPVGPPRRPLRPVDSTTREALRAVLNSLNLLPDQKVIA